MPYIFEYLNYRKFLRDFYEEKKKQNYFFSFRHMALKVQMDHSLLVKVLLEKRHITPKSIKPFAILCDFSKQEELYFETLVNYEKTRSEAQGKIYLEKLLSFKKHASKEIAPYQYEYFRKWYYSALRSLLDFYPFDGKDFKKLGGKLNPPISETEAREAITLLEKIGLIIKNENGIYCPSEKHVSTGENWSSIAVKNYQKETINLSISSLDRDPKENRDVSSVTMSITSVGMQEVQEIIKEFRAAIIKRVDEMNDKERDRVYQLNIQFIPLSRIENNEN